MVPKTFHQNANAAIVQRTLAMNAGCATSNAMECKMRSQWIAINASNQKTRTYRRKRRWIRPSAWQWLYTASKGASSHSLAPPASKMPKKRRLPPPRCVLILEEVDQFPNGTFLVLHCLERLDLVLLRALDLKALDVAQNGRLVVDVSDDLQAT